jgi:hypothetical protein
MSEIEIKRTASELLLEHLRNYGGMPSEKKDFTQSPWWVIVDPTRFKSRLQTYDMEDAGDIVSLITSCISGPYFSRETAELYLKQVSHHFSKDAIVYCLGARDAYEWEWFAKTCRNLASEQMPEAPNATH